VLELPRPAVPALFLSLLALLVMLQEDAWSSEVAMGLLLVVSP
jgi:hypothetical protein